MKIFFNLKEIFSVCILNGRKYKDGAETAVDCNGW